MKKMLLCVLAGMMLFCCGSFTAQAKGEDFVIEAAKLATDEETYNIQVTVENQGEDWEGIVRVIISEDYRDATAYDTVISLPQGSVKQFVVHVPISSIESTDGTVYVALINNKSKAVAEEKFKYLLSEEMEMIPLGILSDNYGDLTYLDMGGKSLYYYRENLPVKLQELSDATLEETLETLSILVIDSYNTQILTRQQIEALEEWVNNGGVLIIGTGEYGEEVLAGFEDSFLGVECIKVYEPGTEKFQLEYADVTRLYLSRLSDVYSQYYNYATGALLSGYGEGAIGVLPYSFTEIADMDADFFWECTREEFVSYILDDVSSYSSKRYYSSLYNSTYNNQYNMRRMLNILGSVNRLLDLGTLKVLVVLYVVFVGPVLYLILRLLKKREWYWGTVPIAAALGVLLVSFAGRGFEVVDTRAYTVTAWNLEEGGEKISYLYCYDAEYKEWMLTLAQGYDYAGAFYNDSYNSGGVDVESCYYRIMKEGNTLSVGITPGSNFEDCYFQAIDQSCDTPVEGGLVGEGIEVQASTLTGSVINNTAYDFEYIAIIKEGILYVYEGVDAGKSLGLNANEIVYCSGQTSNTLNDYMYGCLRVAFNADDTKATSALAALGVGIGSAYPTSDESITLIMGVTSDWETAVDDVCSEMSYGCLYQIQ